ncbi:MULTISPECIES: Hint domain-containing protein [unclassified Marinovum]
MNSDPGISTFDEPPHNSIDLEITPQAGDADPNLFELDELYDLTYQSPLGPVIISDARVIRSDSVEFGTGGVVVFEGLTQDGELVHVVWTPQFDLEGWYADTAARGATPRFFTTDQQSSYSHGVVCFASETRIATVAGAVPAGQVRIGQKVVTLDAGLRPITWIGRQRMSGLGKAAPVVFAPGAIGNEHELRLSQQHRVLVRTPLAELMFGASEVLAPAKALVNGRDIRILPCRDISYVHLLLDSHQILRAEGALCESLLLGDVACDLISVPAGLASRTTRVPARRILRYHEAIALGGADLGGADLGAAALAPVLLPVPALI